MVILGTQYAGEMKKGIFSVMHYLMPKRGILSLHSGCNVGAQEDVTLFFGLSGVPLMYCYDLIHLSPAVVCGVVLAHLGQSTSILANPSAGGCTFLAAYQSMQGNIVNAEALLPV